MMGALVNTTEYNKWLVLAWTLFFFLGGGGRFSWILVLAAHQKQYTSDLYHILVRLYGLAKSI